jgi:hypothetical protein
VLACVQLASAAILFNFPALKHKGKHETVLKLWPVIKAKVLLKKNCIYILLFKNESRLIDHQSECLSVFSPLITFEPLGRFSWHFVGRWCHSRDLDEIILNTVDSIILKLLRFKFVSWMHDFQPFTTMVWDCLHCWVCTVTSHTICIWRNYSNKFM